MNGCAALLESHLLRYSSIFLSRSPEPESLQIFGVGEGVSQKPVAIYAVPKFEDTLNLRKDFNAVTADLLLLTLCVIIPLLGAYLAFVRVQV